MLRALLMRVDNSREFILWDIDLRAYQRDLMLDLSRSEKPTNNVFIESFNGKLRAERLNGSLVLVSCRRDGKVGEIAQIIKRGQAPQRNR
jgi:hypothetical protein